MGTKPENHEQLGEWSGKPFLTEWYTKAEDGITK
jgi:hypothetical protein